METEDQEESELREPNFRNLFFKYMNKIAAAIVIMIILFYIYYQMSLASIDNKAFTSHFLYNIFAIVVPVIGVLCFIMLTTLPKTFGMYVIVGTIFAIALFGMGFYFLQTTLSQYIFNKYLLYFVIIMIGIIGLSIVSTLFSLNLRRQPGWIGFVANFIFYIPCLIRDGIKGAIDEYNSFSRTTLILFVIELVLLLMYFYLIPLLNDRSVPTHVSLLDDPVMLSTAIPLSIAPIFKTSNSESNNFAISMWFYVNPGPNTKIGYTQQTPIFRYAKGETSYFTLNYSNNVKNQTQFNLDIPDSSVTNRFTENIVNPISVSMPLQKWNNIVLNIVTPPTTDTTPNPTTTMDVFIPTTTMDVFINGELSQSILLNTNLTFSSSDIMTIGSGSIDSNIDGLYGAICNIVYYREPLSRLSVIYNYNKLVVKNPPV